MPYEAFYSGNKIVLGRNYALAWALVYYLRKGVPLEKDSVAEGVLDRYEEALWSTGNAEGATDAAFQGVDMDAFDKEFRKFWTTSHKRQAAERKNIL